MMTLLMFWGLVLASAGTLAFLLGITLLLVISSYSLGAYTVRLFRYPSAVEDWMLVLMFWTGFGFAAALGTWVLAVAWGI